MTIDPIAVTLKESYGRTLAYPANEQAHKLAAMLGAKTLTAHVLRQAQDMGLALAYVDRFGRVETGVETAKMLIANAS